jgi:hypothetical protein
MIKSFDKTNVKSIRTEIEEAIDAVAKKHGFVSSAGRITYTDAKVGLRVEFAIPGCVGGGNTMLAVNWNEQCGKHGFAKSDLGKIFISGRGEKFKIVGLKPANRKYPVIAEKLANGKNFKFAPLQVKVSLGIV